MKQKIILLAIALSAIAFTVENKNNSATVKESDDILIFCYSKPVEKYEILGMAKINGLVKNEKGAHMVDLLVEKAKKNFPSGEAIIVGSDFQKCEVIKFN